MRVDMRIKGVQVLKVPALNLLDDAPWLRLCILDHGRGLAATTAPLMRIKVTKSFLDDADTKVTAD